MAAEVEYLGQDARAPRSAVRRGARRREGVGQARGDPEPRPAGRRAADRRRDGLHVLQGARCAGRQSLVEDELLDAAREVERQAKARGTALRAARSITSSRRSSKPARQPRRWTSATRRSAIAWASTSDRRRLRDTAAIIAGAKTVTWNGPMGVFEIDAFARARSRWPGRSPT